MYMCEFVCVVSYVTKFPTTPSLSFRQLHEEERPLLVIFFLLDFLVAAVIRDFEEMLGHLLVLAVPTILSALLPDRI